MQINSKEANFSRTWAEYKLGFGDANSTEFWLGLEKVHQMTKSRSYSLEILLKRDDGTRTTVYYNTFAVGDEHSKYNLSIGDYDPRGSGLPADFSNYNGYRFTTYDQDNDDYGTNCAINYANTGWWYNKCFSWIHLNYWRTSEYIAYYQSSANGTAQETQMTLISKFTN